MKTKIITIMIVAILAVVSPIKADLVFDSGYNTFDDTDPYYNEVGVINDAHLDVLGGQIGKLEFRGYSTGNIYGGEMDWLWTDDNTVVNIYGGSLNILASRPDSRVYLYAYDVTYHPDGGLYNQPWLEGKYISDNNPFSFSFYGDRDYPQLTIVPEPATLLLLALGGLLLRARNNKILLKEGEKR